MDTIMNPATEHPPFSIASLARRWNTSEHTVRTAIHAGRIDAFKLPSGHWRIRPESVFRAEAGHDAQPAGERAA
jgi:predicted site-specific integrase-resolvase